MAKTRKRKNKHKPTHADLADKYDLYLRSVQEPEHEVAFFDKVYCEEFGRRPMVLREDFCGTFGVCCQWARSHKDRRAVGVDLDPEPLTWGRTHNLAELTPDTQQRVTLKQADVRTVNRMKADVLAAQNFSFYVFKTRAEVLDYFRKARANLADKGMMVIDMLGGWECFEPMEDVRKVSGNGQGKPAFKYIWEQAAFNPVNHDASFYIHFRFRDGSELNRAFEYHWRFWSIPEVRELLEEAGFRKSYVYWEEDDDDGDGSDEWHKVESASSDPSWIAYVVAVK